MALASKRIGALIVFQREVGLNEYIEVGTRLEARVSKELIISIFIPSSPIHDGALIAAEGPHHRGRLLPAAYHQPAT